MSLDAKTFRSQIFQLLLFLSSLFLLLLVLDTYFICSCPHKPLFLVRTQREDEKLGSLGKTWTRIWEDVQYPQNGKNTISGACDWVNYLWTTLHVLLTFLKSAVRGDSTGTLLPAAETSHIHLDFLLQDRLCPRFCTISTAEERKR